MLPKLAVCSITELGFVRVATGPARLAPSVRSAQEDLKRLKAERRIILVEDASGAHDLPVWVERYGQVTDGHLARLAVFYHGTLATLDRGIPGSLLIPELPEPSSVVREPVLPYGAVIEWERERRVAAGWSGRCLSAPGRVS